MTLSKKQQEHHTKRDKQKQCRTSHVKYPDPATTRIRPGTRIQYPANLLPVPPPHFSQRPCNYSQTAAHNANHGFWAHTNMIKIN